MKIKFIRQFAAVFLALNMVLSNAIPAIATVSEGIAEVIQPNSVESDGVIALEQNDLKIENGVIIGLQDEAKAKIEGKEIAIENIDGVTSIGENAFRDVKLKSVKIGDSIENIGAHSFHETDLERVIFTNTKDISIGEYAFADNKIVELQDSGHIGTIEKFAFYSNNLTTLTSSAKIIGESAFSGIKLIDVTLDRVEEIRNKGFADNPSLTKLIIKTVNPNDNLLNENSFGTRNEPVEVFIGSNGNNITSKDETKYVINPIELEVLLKDVKNKGLISERIVEKKTLENLPNDYKAPKVPNYKINGESTKVINKNEIKDGKVTIEFLYDKINSPHIVIEDSKQLVYLSNKNLNVREILSNISFFDSLGNKINPFLDNSSTLDSKITLSRENANSSNKSVTITITEGELSDSVTVDFEFKTIDRGNEEIVDEKGWVYNDFKYSGNALTGFSESGLERLKKNKNIILPGINPKTGEPIVRIESSAFSSQVIDTVSFEKMDALEHINHYVFKNTGLSAVIGLEALQKLKFLGYEVFQNNNLTEFDFTKLPALEEIQERTFENNKLVDVNFGGHNKIRAIGGSAFSNNRIERVQLSDTPELRTIGNYAFQNNVIKGELSFSNMPKFQEINYHIFKNNLITSVEFNNLPELTIMRDGAFANNKIESVTFQGMGNFTKFDGRDIFANNKIKEVDFSNLTALEYLNGFQNNLIDELNISDLPKLKEITDVYAFRNNKIREVTFKNLPLFEKIGTHTFVDNPTLKVLNIIDTPKLNTIGTDSFKSTALEEVVLKGLPELTRIDGFENISTLKKVELENLPNVVRIEGFENGGLEEVKVKNLPNLEIFGGLAFYNNRNIKKLELSDLPKLKVFDNHSFRGTNRQGELDLSPFKALEEIKSQAFTDNTISSINFNGLDQLKVIGESSFKSNHIEKIELKDLENLTKVEDEAFFYQLGGQSLRTVVLDNLPELRYLSGFSYNYKLQDLQIGNNLPNLETIGRDAFKNTLLPKVDLSNLPALKKIETSAFFNESYDRKSIKEIKLPKTVEIIDENAFRGNSISDVDLSNLTNLTKLGSYAFNENVALLNTFILPVTQNHIELGKHVATVKEEQLDFSKNEGIKLKLNSAKPFVSGKPLILKFKKASQLFLADKISDLDVNNPTIIYIDEMDTTINPPDGIVINPKKVTFNYKKTDGSTLAESEVKYIGKTTDIKAKSIFGVSLVKIDDDKNGSEITKNSNTRNVVIQKDETTKIKEHVIDFIYGDVQRVPDSKYVVDIKRTGNKNREVTTGTNLGLEAVFDLKGIPQNEKNVKLVIELPKYATDDPKKITFSKDIPFNGKNLEMVEPAYYDPTTRQIIFNIKEIPSENATVAIRAEFQFDGLDTPKNVTTKAKAFYVLENGSIKGNIDESEDFFTTYYDPGLYKDNGFNTVGDIKVPWNDESNGKWVNVSIPYRFYFNNGKRRFKEFTVEDTLPTYTKYGKNGNTTELAVFDPSKNPGWEYDKANNKVRLVVNKDELDQMVHDNGIEYIHEAYISSRIPTLVLDFPQAIPQKDIKNTAKLELKVDNPSHGDKVIYTKEDDQKNNILIDYLETGIKYEKISNIGGYYLPTLSEDTTKDYLWRLDFSPTYIRSVGENETKKYLPKFDDLEIWDFYLDGSSSEKDKILEYKFFEANVDMEVYMYNIIVPGWDHSEKSPKTSDDNLVSQKKFIKAGQRLLLTDDERTKTKSVKFVPKNYVVKSVNDKINITIGTKLIDGKIIPFADRTIPNRSKYFLKMSVPELNIDKRELSGISSESKYVRKTKKYLEVTKTSNVDSRNAITRRDTRVSYTLGFNSGYIPDIYNERFFIKDFKLIDVLPEFLDLESVTLNPDFVAAGGTYRTLSSNTDSKIIFESPYAPSDLRWIAKIDTTIKSSAPGNAEIVNKAYLKFTDDAKNDDERIEVRKKEVVKEENNEMLSVAATTFRLLTNDSLTVNKYIRDSEKNGIWKKDIDTYPDHTFEYKLEVSNNVPIDVNNISVIDIFPGAKDRHLSANLLGINSLRGSDFSNIFVRVKSVKLVDNDTGVATDASSFYPVKYITNTDGYPGHTLEKNIRTWIAEKIDDSNSISTTSENAEGIYLGGLEASKIPRNNKLEIILEFKTPKFKLEKLSEWEGKRSVNTYGMFDKTTKTSMLESNQVSNVMISPVKKIRILKKNEKGEPLENAVFELTQGDITKKAVSGPDGIAYFNDVKYKPYTVREIKSPSGYQLNTEKKVIDLSYEQYYKDLEKLKKGESIDENPIEFVNKEIPPPDTTKTYSIKIIKKNNSLFLSSVKFKLTNLDTNDVVQGLTAANGEVEFVNLLAGQYKLEEISNLNRFTLIEPVILNLPLPDGFTSTSIENIDSETETTNVDNNEHVHTKYTFEVQNRKYDISLVKIGVKELVEVKKDYQRRTSDGEKLRNVKFNLYNTGKTVGKEVTGNEKEILDAILITDNNGRVTINNLTPKTIYRLEEIEAPNNYVKEKPVEFYVDEKGNLKSIDNEAYKVNSILLVSNNREKKTSSLIVNKIDYDTKMNLSGAIFKILKFKNGSYQELEDEKYTKTTDENGTLRIDEIPYGQYKIEEITPPSGYLRGVEPLYFNVDAFNSRLFEKTVKNKKIKFNVIKVEKIAGPFSDTGSANNELEKLRTRTDFNDLIVAENSIFKKLKGAEFTLKENYRDGNIDKRATINPTATNIGGYSYSLYSEGLKEFGSYVLEETKAPVGYVKSRPQNIRLDRLINFNNAEAFYYLKNSKQRGQINITKFEGRNRKVLPGAQFTVYKGRLTKDQLSKDKEVNVSTTDNEGIIRIVDLELGEYTIVENSAPKTYKKSDDLVYAELTPENPISRHSFYNQLETTTLRLNKVDDNGNPINAQKLANAKFELYYDGKFHSTGASSTENGVIEFSNVPIIGDYKIKEVIPPEGYKIFDNGELSFETTKDAPLKVDKLKNTPKVMKNKEQIEIIASKTWDGGLEANRPDVFFKLYRRYNNTEEEVPNADLKHVGKKNVSDINFGQFDKYNNVGENSIVEYEYFVKEVDSNGSSLNLASNKYVVTNNNGLDIRNTYESEKINIKVTKQWVNGENAQKPDLNFELYRKTNLSPNLEKVENMTKKVPVSGILDVILNRDYEVIFEQLPVTDKNENVYTYVVKEVKNDGNEIDDSINFKPRSNTSEAVKLEGQNYLSAGFVNRYVSPVKNVKATVTWVNGPQVKPDVWFKLYRKTNGGTLSEVDVPVTKVDQNIREVSWSDLPVTDEQGNEYIYSVKETNKNGEIITPENYSKLEEGLNVTNTYVIPKTSRTVQKEWELANGEQKTEVTIHLKRDINGQNDVNFDESIALNESKKWKYKFINLDKTNIDGDEYVYRVEEERKNAYQTTVEVLDDNTEFVVKNKQVYRDDIPVHKNWDNKTKDIDPSSVNIKLLRNNKVYKEVSLNAAKDWRSVFSNLPKYDNNDVEYKYEISEEELKGYETNIDQQTGEITNRKKSIDLEVDKIWVDESDSSDKPDTITIKLLRNDLEYETLTLTKGNNENIWSGIFENLPEYDLKGNKYIYKIDEVDIPGYKKNITDKQDHTNNIVGKTITNTRILTTVHVNKVWNNNERVYPNQITYRLFKNGTEINSKTVDSSNWDVEFVTDKNNKKLAKVNPKTGLEYVYSVTEDEVKGYSTDVKLSNNADKNSFTITNTQKTRKIQLEKKWVNGPKPNSTLVLKRKLPADAARNLQEESDTNFSKEFTATVDNPRSEEYEVPTHSPDQREYEYYVEEENVPEDYTHQINGFVVTNTYKSPKTDITAIKNWNGGPSDRPTVWFKLFRKIDGGQGQAIDQEAVKELDKITNEVTWNDLDQKDINGNRYTYYVKEVDQQGINEAYVPENYTKSESGITVTNTYVIPKIEKTIENVWDNFIDGETKPEITVVLKRSLDGKPDTAFNETLVLNNTNNWESIFKNLDKTDINGKEYVYDIETINHPAYTTRKEVLADNSGFKIINTPNVLEKKVSKVWVNNTDEENPYNVEVKLLRNGKEYKNVVLNSINQWKHTFGNLPTHDSQKNEYRYSIKEVNVPSYTTSINEATGEITNTKEEISIEVVKNWIDNSRNLDKPKKIVINLYRNKSTNPTPYKTLELKANGDEDRWINTFTHLPKFDGNGIEYTYEIDEEQVAGYEKVINEYSVTNTRKLITIPVVKTWENTESTYPENITYRLYRDGDEIATYTANKDSWNHLFEVDGLGNKLPQTNPKTGIDYDYTVEENPVKGYVSRKSPENKYNIINTQITKDIVLEKQWINGPKPDAKLTLKRKVKADVANNLTEQEDLNFRKDFTATVSKSRSEVYKVPTYRADGREYEYYVIEENVADNYTSDTKGFVITNTYTIPKVEVKASKIWKDNKFANRPRSWFKLIRRNSKTKEVEELNDTIKELAYDKENPKEEILVAWKDIEKTDKYGNEYIFNVKEVDSKGNDYTPIGYEKEEDGLAVTNKLIFVPGVPGDGGNDSEKTNENPKQKEPNKPGDANKPNGINVVEKQESSETIVKNTILPRTGSRNENLFSVAISLLAVSIAAILLPRRYE